MKKGYDLRPERLRWVLMLVAWGIYALAGFFHQKLGESLIILISIIPVIVASRYFNMLVSILSVLTVIIINGLLFLNTPGFTFASSFTSRSALLKNGIFLFIAYVVGHLSNISQKQKRELFEHETSEKERQGKLQTALYQVSMVLSSPLDEDDIFEKVVNTLGNVLGYDHTNIFMVDVENGDRVRKASFNWPKKLMADRLPPGQGLSERPLLDGKLHYSANVTDEQRYVPGIGGSEVDVPIRIGDFLVGVLTAQSKQTNAFNQNDLDVLSAVANLTGLALAHTRLIGTNRRQAQQYSSLFQLSTLLATQFDKRSICQQACDTLHREMGYSHNWIFLVDEATQERVLWAGQSKIIDRRDIRIPPGEGLSERPLKDHKPHYTPDISLDQNYYSYKNAVSGSLGAEIDVPIWIGESVEGVLVAENDEPYAFDQSDIDILSAAANIVGLALTREKLLSAERRQFEELAILHTIAVAAVDAIDEDQLIEHATHIIGENLYPDNFGILLANENKEELTVHPSYNISKKLNPNDLVIPYGKGIVGRVVQTGLPERIDDISLSDCYLDVDPHTRSELAVPLKLGKRIIGVINAESVKQAAFSYADERLMVTLAGQLASSIDRLRTASAERKQAEELAVLNDLAKSLTQNLDVESVVNETYRGVTRLVDTTNFYIGILSTDKRHVTFPINISSSEEDKSIEAISSEEGLTGHILKTMSPVLINDGTKAWAKENRVKSVGENAQSWLGVPLLIGDEAIGVMAVQDHENSNVYDAHDLDVLSAIASQAAIAIQNARLFSNLQQMAIIDELTGLYNRRHFSETARIEFSRARRYNRALSVMMLDIDHFKKFNDTYGHAVGDQVLADVASICKQCLRETDTVGRYGGEEFVVLLAETRLSDAQIVAERIRKEIANRVVSTEHGDLSVTISIGVAENSDLTPTLDTLIARADQAMYVAKHKGRNQIVAGM